MISKLLIDEFEALLGKENVLSDEIDRHAYSFDAAVLESRVPSLVLLPTQTEQLGTIVKKCYDEGLHITVRGSGSNLSGGTIPDSKDTVVIATGKLNKIIEINTHDLYAVVEPGLLQKIWLKKLLPKDFSIRQTPAHKVFQPLAAILLKMQADFAV